MIETCPISLGQDIKVNENNILSEKTLRTHVKFASFGWQGFEKTEE
ncbi:hypothetical protein N6H05_03565 [Sphingobium sp. WTD-1]|nr:hypothetical protein [Sphingobium sp. WTD-1]WIA56901.1 hypothetical protein N6H05_03565 [Sphingobium sp. WTD-1]